MSLTFLPCYPCTLLKLKFGCDSMLRTWVYLLMVPILHYNHYILRKEDTLIPYYGKSEGRKTFIWIWEGLGTMCFYSSSNGYIYFTKHNICIVSNIVLNSANCFQNVWFLALPGYSVDGWSKENKVSCLSNKGRNQYGSLEDQDLESVWLEI